MNWLLSHFLATSRLQPSPTPGGAGVSRSTNDELEKSVLPRKFFTKGSVAVGYRQHGRRRWLFCRHYKRNFEPFVPLGISPTFNPLGGGLLIYRASVNRRESHTPPHKEGTFPPRRHISGGLLWSARIVFAFLSESSAKGVRHSYERRSVRLIMPSIRQ